MNLFTSIREKHGKHDNIFQHVFQHVHIQTIFNDIQRYLTIFNVISQLITIIVKKEKIFYIIKEDG
jgi:hypothetical protein